MIESSSLDATPAAYDAVATRYAELFRDSVEYQPLDRAMVTAFAESVRAAGARPVADLGCGPCGVTARLASLDVTAFGVDASPAMLELTSRCVGAGAEPAPDGQRASSADMEETRCPSWSTTSNGDDR